MYQKTKELGIRNVIYRGGHLVRHVAFKYEVRNWIVHHFICILCYKIIVIHQDLCKGFWPLVQNERLSPSVFVL